MTATLSSHQLQWDQTTQWANFPELGYIYTQTVTVEDDDKYSYQVAFHVSDVLRRLGMLFVEVKTIHETDSQTLNYCLGEFNTNKGAMKFAQFALDNFIEHKNWAVCPSFKYVDWVGGDPYDLAGDEIVCED
jgi:hypothetical protein